MLHTTNVITKIIRKKKMVALRLHRIEVLFTNNHHRWGTQMRSCLLKQSRSSRACFPSEWQWKVGSARKDDWKSKKSGKGAAGKCIGWGVVIKFTGAPDAQAMPAKSLVLSQSNLWASARVPADSAPATQFQKREGRLSRFCLKPGCVEWGLKEGRE